jgi:hypothetical protein
VVDFNMAENRNKMVCRCQSKHHQKLALTDILLKRRKTAIIFRQMTQVKKPFTFPILNYNAFVKWQTVLGIKKEIAFIYYCDSELAITTLACAELVPSILLFFCWVFSISSILE